MTNAEEVARNAESDACPDHACETCKVIGFDQCWRCERCAFLGSKSDDLQRSEPTNWSVERRWTANDHPPHSWPIGSPDGWRQGSGCPTVWCKGEGSQRDETYNTRPTSPVGGADLHKSDG